MAIIFENASFYYGKHKVLKDLSLSLEAGKSIAILGANGAGKTTLTKLVTGALKPMRGTVSVFGLNPRDTLTKRMIGTAPQELEFPSYVTTREVVAFVSKHYSSPRSIDESIDLFNLRGFASSYATQLSGGEKRRLALAIAFCCRPRLVVLDEPTTGLDQSNRRQIWDFIKDFQSEGGTVVLTSHYSNEVHEIAHDLIVLREGEVVRSGNYQEHRKASELSRVVFRATTKPKLTTAALVEHTDDILVYETANSDDTIIDLVNSRVEFSDLEIIHRSFSEYVEDLIGAN